MFCRMNIPIVQNGVRSFEIFAYVMYSVQFAVKMTLLLVKKQQFDKFLCDIDVFLKRTHVNPINTTSTFSEFWEKMKPIKYTACVAIFYTIVIISPIFEIVNTLTVSGDNVTESFYHFYSPGFTYNIYMKWMYSINDICIDILMNFLAMHEHVLCLTWITFQTCQFIYLKELAEEIFKQSNGKSKEDNVKWWIECHQHSLR